MYSKTMANATIPVNLNINIPTTAKDWELFTVSMDCTAAADALTAALKEAIADISEGLSSVDDVMRRYMHPVMRKYRAFGAADSEPLYIAESTLEAVERTTRWRPSR